jgi:hypothetical protein
VHGFGFAGALAEIGLPTDRAAAALACFNLGVEAGQLVVLSALWPLLLWLHRKQPRPFMKLMIVVNIAIVLLGTAWAIERSLGGGPAAATDISANASTTRPTRAASDRPRDAAATPTRDSDRSIAPSDIRPLYPSVATSRVAERICHIAARFPRERHSECSGEPIGITFDGECTQMLSAALASGAVKAAEGLEGRCVSAMESRYETCEFMQYASLSPIAACSDLWQGQLAAGAVCRSSLECQTGLYCHGIGATRAGVCGAPKPKGASCGTAIDALAAYLPHKDSDHPECTERCGQGGGVLNPPPPPPPAGGPSPAPYLSRPTAGK